MRLTPWRCPECDQPAKGILETIPGIARLHFDEDGSAEYAGGTDVGWDGQESVLAPDGRVTLVCPDGHEWLASIEEGPSESLP
jgi:hypothetical protein